MPTYEVRRRTVLAVATVTAANETEARFLARDVWQQDAAIAALAADVLRVPHFDPMDELLDAQSELRYLETEGDRDHDRMHAERALGRAESDSEADPWP